MGFSAVTAAKKDKAIALRLSGKSYGQIKKELGIPSKGTLSVWFRHLRLSSVARKRLENNTRVAVERGLCRFNQERSKRIVRENNTAAQKGKQCVGPLSKRELLLIGAALYWGEGTKKYKNIRSAYLSFSNSDPRMVSVFMRFIREVLQVPEERIRGGIHLYPGTDVQKTREHWAQVTGLPPERFYVHKQVSRASQGKKKWNTLPHGTLAIRACNRRLFHEVMGVINGIAGV